MKKRIGVIAFLVFLVLYPLFVGMANYPVYLATLVAVYAIISMALNLLTGFGGQVSIGHASFLAIGAYASAILTLNGVTFWLAFPLAGLITAVIGLVVGLPAVRLSGHFLAVATLGFGVAIPELLLKWDAVTGGFSGLFTERPALGGFTFDTDVKFYYLTLVLTVLITWMIKNIISSRAGRAFVAIRESEIAATAVGINVPLYKTIMFSVSAFFTGLAGSIYAHFVGYISPHDFNITISFLVLAMIVIGGMASIPGSIIGAILLTILPQFTDKLLGLTSVITGLVLVVIVLFLPEGLVSFSSKFTGKKARSSVTVSGQNQQQEEKAVS